MDNPTTPAYWRAYFALWSKKLDTRGLFLLAI